MPLDNNIKFKKSIRKKPLILVTNDDGVHSAGIKELTRRLKRVGDLLVVAPAFEQSATSHSLTLHRPLRCDEIAKNTYIVDGTPTDCVNLAVNFILKGRRPDMLFSGINRGPNMGDDVHYSGTVSAAVEGGIIGVPSVAVSVTGSLSDAIAGRGGFRFDVAGAFSEKLARLILKKWLPKGVILNVNVPNLPAEKIKGHKITFQGKKNYINIATEKIDPRNKKYYWISGEEAGFDNIPGSDCNAVSMGIISITPIRVNLTHEGSIKELRRWKF